jgi:outer membrane protein assembly factor BamB
MKKNKVLHLAATSLLLGSIAVAVAGCSCNTNVAQYGWAPPVFDDSYLYVASSEGSILTLNKVNGTLTYDPLKVKGNSGASGLLGCGYGAGTVIFYGSPYINDGLLYASGYDGNVYTFDVAKQLSNKKQLDEDKSMSVISGIVGDGKNIYVGCSDGSIYALDNTTLETVWSYETGDKIWSTPVLNNGTVYVTSFDHSLYALSAEDGSLKWSFATDGPVIASPVFEEDTIYVASFDRSVYAVNAGNGEMKWKLSTELASPRNWFWATPVICGNYLVAPNNDGCIYSIDKTTGKMENVIDLEKAISSSPVVINNKVYVIDNTGNLYSIDPSNGFNFTRIKELETTVNSDLVADGDLIYVHSQKDETIYCVNALNGVLQWSHEV